MPPDIHALVQDTDNPNSVFRPHVKHDVGVIFPPSQAWREGIGLTSTSRLFCQELTLLVQAHEIDPRLVECES